MSTTRTTITIKESVTFTLYEADLTAKKVGDKIATPNRVAPLSNGLQWWIMCYPAGIREAFKGHVTSFLWVNKPVKAKYTFAVDGSSISETDTQEFKETPTGWGWGNFASHEELRPLFRDGKLTITCRVEFDVSSPVSLIPRNFQLFESAPVDVDFIVGSEIVPAHKYFLSLISPVFRAMFAHNTAESKSGKIVITEFDVDTVKAAIDICYGRELEKMSAEIVVNILRFCDKYFITAVSNELEKLPFLNLTTCNFCLIVRYAYDCNKDSLLTECFSFFKNHQDEVKATEEFAKLPLTIVVTVIKSAFGLKTDFDVLHHAHKNGNQFVVDHLERPLIESLTLDTFCPAVNFAWQSSRDELKNVCARFLNDHHNEVMMLSSFFELPPEFIQGVLKLGYDLKCSSE